MSWRKGEWSLSNTGLKNSSVRDLTAFCEAHYESLVRLLSVYCGDLDLAEDLAQEALIAVCRDWRKVKNHPLPEAWLRKVALNVANSHFRRRKAERRRQERLESHHPQAHHDPDVAVSVALRDAVATLPNRQRMALVLRFFADLPVGTVAMLMECSEGTVKSLTNRAISSIREAWDEQTK